MKCLLLPASILLLATLPDRAADDSFTAPDTITLKDGSKLRGLIVKNTAAAVTLQQEFLEKQIPKSDILRIDDHPDVLYTDIPKKGDLPSWRVIANDLRTHDVVKSLVEIPATVIDVGEFQRVPYKSFRVNRDVELNIYGDPNDPAAVEMGIYGAHSGNAKLRKILRGYLAGFLTTKQEVGALYSLDLKGGVAQAGDITIEITPKDAPDAYGAWWITLYNKKDIENARLDPAEYARITKPMDEVFDNHGRVRSQWTPTEAALSERMNDADDDTMVILRGFYRDKNGDFRLLTDKN